MATSAVSNAVIVTIDNLTLGGPSSLISAGNATFNGQGFTPNTAGVGTGDTVAANLPLSNPVQLLTISVVGRSSTGGTAGNIFLDIYSGNASGAPAAANYIGSSTNFLDVEGALDNQILTFNFNSLNLIPSTTYTFYFSTNNVAGGAATGRVEAAGFPPAGNESTYAGGNSIGTASFNAISTLDMRFSATFDSVPEPTVAMLGGLGVLGLLRRRRA